MEVSDEDIHEGLDETEVEKVLVQRDPVLEEYTSEEDESHSLSKTGKSNHPFGVGGTEDSIDENGQHQVERTPALHRMKTKLLKNSSKKRLHYSVFFTKAIAQTSPRVNNYGKYAKQEEKEMAQCDPYSLGKLKQNLQKATDQQRMEKDEQLFGNNASSGT